jgi:plastocyanin
MLLAVVGCTAGAPPGGGSGTSAGTTIIDVSLSAGTLVSTPFGNSIGFMPPVSNVSVGTMLQFVNRDTFAHTATSVTGTTFPADPGFTSSALDPSGSRLSSGWTSGNLAPGAASPPVLADAPGTYLYGCFYHYSGGMHAAVVVH